MWEWILVSAALLAYGVACMWIGAGLERAAVERRKKRALRTGEDMQATLDGRARPAGL